MVHHCKTEFSNQPFTSSSDNFEYYYPIGDMSQLMRFWYLSHRRPAKAKASLRICAVSPEPLLFAHMNYSRRRIRQKIRHLAPLDGCAGVFEEWIYWGQKVPKSRELARMLWGTYSSTYRWVCPATPEASVLLQIVLILLKKNQRYMSLVARKPVFGMFDQVRLKPACSATETS